MSDDIEHTVSSDTHVEVKEEFQISLEVPEIKEDKLVERDIKIDGGNELLQVNRIGSPKSLDLGEDNQYSIANVLNKQGMGKDDQEESHVSEEEGSVRISGRREGDEG